MLCSVCYEKGEEAQVHHRVGIEESQTPSTFTEFYDCPNGHQLTALIAKKQGTGGRAGIGIQTGFKNQGRKD